MSKGRLEAFSDGVLAIIITIMVLELTPPHGASLDDLRPLAPTFVSYVLSFVIIGIYWNNHHHLLQAARTIDGRALWANLHLLFWLSLFPFGTGWMGEHQFASTPVALYAAILLFAAIAYFILVRALILVPGQPPTLALAVGSDTKGRISPLMYLAAILIALIAPVVSVGLYVLVAVIWVVPARRIERALGATRS